MLYKRPVHGNMYSTMHVLIITGNFFLYASGITPCLPDPPDVL